MNALLMASGPSALATLIASLWSSSAAALTHRDLSAGLLVAGHEVGVQAVPVPRQVYACSEVMTPAADRADRGITPVRCPLTSLLGCAEG